jgi:choice-of-anchor C domain-containing protein
MKIKGIFCYLLAIVFAVASYGVSFAAPFQNGSFEIPGGFSENSFSTYRWNSTLITGWRVFDNDIDYGNFEWDASEGTHSIDLNGTQPGGIEQTFDTIPATKYEVLFDIAGNPNSIIIKTLEVNVTDNLTIEYSFDTTGFDRQNMGWTTRSYTFVASTNSSTLQFLSTTDGAGGPTLDNVRVNVVPIPSAICLFGSGLIGFVVLRRKFKR